MAIDSSIYQGIHPVQAPSYLDSVQKAASLSTLGMQNAQLANEMQTKQMAMQQQMALRQAYAANTDKTGTVDQGGVKASLAQLGMGHMIPQLDEQFSKQNKESADAKNAQLEGAQKTLSLTGPAFDRLASMPEPIRAQEYPNVIQQLKSQGVDVSKMDHPYDPNAFSTYYGNWQGSKQKLENMLTQASTSEKYAQAAKARAETPKPFLGKIDPTVDPATMVPSYVPKDQQVKVSEEIKNAQDIKALAPKIQQAFVMGSSRNPIIAAQGQRMFEGLINTTVKDAEGTTRQAAFDSIHKTMTPSGLTASPGENESKWKTVEAYLSSKASAPLAKAHGIDLSKFDSTSPYSAQQRAIGGSALVPEAQAGEPAKMSPEDKEAISWANQNFKDPRAKQILKMHGLF